MTMATKQILTLPPSAGAEIQRGSIFFVGTATVVLRYGGFTILTDPNFLHQGDHIHLGFGLQAQRLTEPAFAIEQLPPIDLVVLSHLHEDHFDRLVEQKLDPNIPIITTPHAAAALKAKGFSATQALARWDTLVASKGQVDLSITAMPARHGPAMPSKLLPAVMGSMLDFTSAGERLIRIYITGDTVMHDQISEIPRRYPGIDIALLHLGGTRIGGLLLTMDAQQGVRMLRIIKPGVAIPIHYDDYNVFKSPLSEFQRAVKEARLEDRVHYLDRGETYEFAIQTGRQEARVS
jgi:L-ascorbate metabolism protein UlaG (beta-lactamase superfamily)